MLEAVTRPLQLESWMVYNFRTKRKVNAQTMLRSQILLLFAASALVPTLQNKVPFTHDYMVQQNENNCKII